VTILDDSVVRATSSSSLVLLALNSTLSQMASRLSHATLHAISNPSEILRGCRPRSSSSSGQKFWEISALHIDYMGSLYLGRFRICACLLEQRARKHDNARGAVSDFGIL
jgi:hypothetical protein